MQQSAVVCTSLGRHMSNTILSGIVVCTGLGLPVRVVKVKCLLSLTAPLCALQWCQPYPASKCPRHCWIIRADPRCPMVRPNLPVTSRDP